MKNAFILLSMMLSASAFSQSYLILNNGVTLTTDTKGFIYDFAHFNLPSKVSLNGGQFFVSEDKLVTIDSAGLLFEKSQEVKKTKGKGINFLLNDKNKLITVDDKGFSYSFDDKAFSKISSFGGKFFVVKSDDKKIPDALYTVNAKGNYFNVTLPGLNPADILVRGGNYFQMKNGLVYTISKDGFVFSKTQIQVQAIKKLGGNYFVDAANTFFTVSEEGALTVAALPLNLIIANISKMGSNYVIDSEGRFFAVDNSGLVFERTVNNDLKSTKILSL